MSTKFATCTVREEQPQKTGRLDLEIEEPDVADSFSVIRHALLELKVLRSFGSTGDTYTEDATKKGIEDGVDQAATYRDERNAKASALCCFDMRKNDIGYKCFDHVKAKADKLAVELRVWFLYPSAKAYREGLVKRS